MTGTANASPTAWLSDSGPNAVSTRSVPSPTAATTPSASRSKNAEVTARASSGDVARALARINFCGSPGRGRWSRPHPVTSPAKGRCAATATWCPASSRRCPRPVDGATSPREPAATIRIRM